MKAYSEDLRGRVLAAVEAGTPHAEIVRVMRVSLATVGRYVRLRREGRPLVATMTVEGSTNKEVFLTCLAHVLCPVLRPGQGVIMDNLSVHKNEAVREKIEACGGRLVFLPACSPDFSPIEHAFSKLKAFLGKAKARTQEALESAIAAGLAALTGENARGWFAHCGFPIAQSA